MGGNIANNEPVPEYSSIKRTLNSILLAGDSEIAKESKEQIKQAIDRRVICATRIAGLGSLYTLYTIYSSIEHGDFEFFKRDPKKVLEKCFNSFLPSSSIYSVEDDFKQLIDKYSVQWPECRLLSNITKYVIDEYRVNFENNIKLHGQKRVKLYFSVCGVETTKKEIEETIRFMFDDESDAVPNKRLIHAIPNIAELGELGIDINKRGFFAHMKWFTSVLVFVSMQMDIYDIQKEIKVEHAADPNCEKKLISNFTVVPICTQQRRHIRIDNDVLHCMLKELDLDPKRKGKRKGGKEVQIPIKDFIENAHTNWFKFFDWKKFKKMKKKTNKFSFQINTDGVSATVLFENTQREHNVQPAGYIDAVAEQFNEFEIQCGIDTGYKNPIAGVIRHADTGIEENVKISARQFRTSTADKKRARIRQKLAGDFELVAAADRDSYDETPSPMGANWFDYIVHRLKLFERAIDTYTNPK